VNVGTYYDPMMSFSSVLITDEYSDPDIVKNKSKSINARLKPACKDDTVKFIDNEFKRIMQQSSTHQEDQSSIFKKNNPN